MSCKINSHKTFFGILSLVFLPVFLSFFFLGTDTHAVSDITYTFTWPNIPSWYALCSNTDCSSYNYFSVVPSNPYTCTGVVSFYVAGLSNRNIQVSACSPSVYVLDYSSVQSSISLTGGLSGSSYSGDITVTLSVEPPFGTSCPVCPTCPDIPENPYDPKLDEITRAIYVTAGTLIVLYFFYCIYRLIIKNSGVH